MTTQKSSSNYPRSCCCLTSTKMCVIGFSIISCMLENIYLDCTHCSKMYKNVSLIHRGLIICCNELFIVLWKKFSILVASVAQPRQNFLNHYNLPIRKYLFRTIYGLLVSFLSFLKFLYYCSKTLHTKKSEIDKWVSMLWHPRWQES